MNFRKETNLHAELCYLLIPFTNVTFNSFFIKLNVFESCYLKENNCVKAKSTDELSFILDVLFFMNRNEFKKRGDSSRGTLLFTNTAR